MTDDRAEFAANRDAGLVKRHEQRLARVREGIEFPADGVERTVYLEGEPVTDMVIPPARERLIRAAAYAMYLDRWHGDPTEGQFTHERYDDAEQQATVAVDAVLALLPAEAETKALVETATRLGRELGRREAAEDIAQELEGYTAHYPEDIFPPDGESRDAIAAAAMRHAYPNAARIAREIATKEPTP